MSPRPNDGTSTPPLLRWAHRGEGTEVWLRVELPVGGMIGMRRAGADGPDRPLSGHLGPGHHDLRLPAILLATSGAERSTVPTSGPVGRWTLVAAGDPVVADEEATATLRPIAIVVGGRPVTVKVRGEDGQATVTVSERRPWVEVTMITPSGPSVEVTGVLQGMTIPTGSDAVSAALVDRDDGSRRDLAVRVDPGAPPDPSAPAESTVRVTIDLAGIPPVDTTRHRNVVLHLDGQDLRFAALADDLVGKHRLVLATPYESPVRGRWWSTTLRFTDRDHLVVTTTGTQAAPPVDPLGSWEQEHGTLLQEAGEAATTRRRGRLLRALAHAATSAVAWSAARARRRAAPSDDRPTRHQVHLLLANLYAAGGTVRATANLANALAPRDDTEVHLISVYRLLRRRFVPVDARVHTRILVDEPYLDEHPGRGPTTWVRARLRTVPSVLIPDDDPRAYRFSLYSDLQLVRWLRSIRTGTIVTTRAGLSVAAARFARPGVRIIAQQHVPFETQAEPLQRALLDSYRRVDAVSVLTEADAAILTGALSTAGTLVRILPNPLEELPGGPPDAPLRAPRLVCGGRISPVKGTDLLLEAFARAAATRPEWELRIFGSARADRLAAAQQLIRDHGLIGRALLLPPTERFDLELAKASICAVPSRHEAFGMVIIEALQAGVPVVAFDCPVGPGEILTDGRDGLLVPREDVEAFAVALGRLMDDATLRRELAAAGRVRAADFAPAAVAAGFVDLLGALD